MSAREKPGAPPPIPDDLPAWVRDLPDAADIPNIERPPHWVWLGVLSLGGTLVIGSVLWAWPSGAHVPKTAPEAKLPPAAAPAQVAALPPPKPPEPPPPPEPTERMAVEFDRQRTAALDHFRAGRYAQAAEAYGRAAKLNPGHTGVLAGLGAARARAGDLPGAQKAYQAAVRAAPKHSGFRAALGRVYRDQGRRDDAASEYRLALKLDPKNKAARKALAELSKRRHH